MRIKTNTHSKNAVNKHWIWSVKHACNARKGFQPLLFLSETQENREPIRIILIYFYHRMRNLNLHL